MILFTVRKKNLLADTKMFAYGVYIQRSNYENGILSVIPRINDGLDENVKL